MHQAEDNSGHSAATGEANPGAVHDDHDECLGCGACLPMLACRRVARATGFTLAAYSFVAKDGSGQRDEVEAEAYGIALPDGRAVTCCTDSNDGADPELRVWPDIAQAARHWGAWVLWSDFPNRLSARR